jgi:hypothetical protein
MVKEERSEGYKDRLKYCAGTVKKEKVISLSPAEVFSDWNRTRSVFGYNPELYMSCFRVTGDVSLLHPLYRTKCEDHFACIT